jgi:hypothetical protein
MGDGASVTSMRGDILHYTINSVDEHNRMIAERYAPLGAQKMYDEGRRTSPVKAVFSAWFAFIRAYFLKLGFLDGYAGFCIAYFRRPSCVHEAYESFSSYKAAPKDLTNSLIAVQVKVVPAPF